MSTTIPPEPRDTAAPGAGSIRRDAWDRNVVAVCVTIALSAVTLAYGQCATHGRIDDTNAQVADIRAEMRAEHAEMRAEHAEMRAIHVALAEIGKNVAVLMDRAVRQPDAGQESAPQNGLRHSTAQTVSAAA